MRNLFVVLAALMLMATVACGGSAPEVKATFDKSVDASAFKTFSFPEQLSLEGQDFPAELGPMVREAAKERLTKRGYTYVSLEENPDLVFNFSLAIKRIKEEKTVTVAKPRSPGVGGAIADYNSNSGEFSERKEIIEYDEGTVRADAIDVAGKKLFWECVVIGELKNRDPNKRKEKVDGVLDLIFEKWTFTPGA